MTVPKTPSEATAWLEQHEANRNDFVRAVTEQGVYGAYAATQMWVIASRTASTFVREAMNTDGGYSQANMALATLFLDGIAEWFGPEAANALVIDSGYPNKTYGPEKKEPGKAEPDHVDC